MKRRLLDLLTAPSLLLCVAVVALWARSDSAADSVARYGERAEAGTRFTVWTVLHLRATPGKCPECGSSGGEPA